MMQNISDLELPEQGLLEQILNDLEVREPEELAAMQAEGDRIIAEAMAQKRQMLIIHQRIGNRKKLESFLCHAHNIRKLPAIRRNLLQIHINENFEGELELRIADNSHSEAEAAFRNAISERTPFFEDVTAVDEDGCRILRSSARLFELVARSEPF